jgi:hypothetical protein
MKRMLVLLATLAALAAAPVYADPHHPGGQFDQCTGPAAERPASCLSPKK